MKFKIDENLPWEVAALLRSAGHDAETVVDEGLTAAEDPRVAEVALTEGRAIVTMDLGFGDIRTYPPSAYSGIIVLRTKTTGRAAALGLVSQLIPLLSMERLSGQLWIVEDGQVRIRE